MNKNKKDYGLLIGFGVIIWLMMQLVPVETVLILERLIEDWLIWGVLLFTIYGLWSGGKVSNSMIIYVLVAYTILLVISNTPKVGLLEFMYR